MLKINFPQWDENLFLYLNSKNSTTLDPIMSFLSSTIVWAVVCLSVILIMIYRYRHQGLQATVFLVAGLASNSIANYVIKALVKRPRPANAIEGVHQLGGIDLSYSFFSSHTSNSICLAMFVLLYFKYKGYGFVLFLWALWVAYSRIYVGRHYPIDIFCGLLFGLVTGSVAYWAYRLYVEKYSALNR